MCTETNLHNAPLHYLMANFTSERLHTRVNMGMLLQTGGGGEGFAALLTRVLPRSHVVCTDVSLQVAGVREHLMK